MSMRNRFVVFMATIALLCASSPVMAKTTFPAIGGRGDAGFEDSCPAHQFLIGLAGHAGLWIDQVQLICAPIQPDGTHGAKYYGVPYGGGGGGPIEFSCGLNSFVSGATIYLFASDHLKVARVALTCFSKEAVEHTPERYSFVDFTGTDTSSTSRNYLRQQECPNDELGVGFHGSYGKDVNALGLDCEVRSTRPASPPPLVLVPAKPIRTTGRPVPSPATAGAPEGSCAQGTQWRLASPSDRVCVTPAQSAIAADQNRLAASRVDPTDQTYGPNTCARGYVWRAAFPGDVVCVTPTERAEAKRENAAAPPPPST